MICVKKKSHAVVCIRVLHSYERKQMHRKLYKLSVGINTQNTIAKVLFTGFLCLALRNKVPVHKGKFLYTFSSYIFYIPFYCPLFNLHNIGFPTRHINTFIYNTSKPQILIISVLFYLVVFAFPHHLSLARTKLHLFSYH